MQSTMMMMLMMMLSTIDSRGAAAIISRNPPTSISKGTLIFFCGKMGSGKTTSSHQISKERNAVLLSEDEWLSSLYPNKISSIQDYVIYSNLLKVPMKSLVTNILNTGTNVVMDYPANTIKQRQWFRDILLTTKGNDDDDDDDDDENSISSSYSSLISTMSPHELILLDNVTDEICLERIIKRGRLTDTIEMFTQMNQYFVPPTMEEGFTITRL